MKAIVQRLWRRDRTILVLFAVLVQIFYWQTRQAGYVTDFTGLMERIETGRFSDVWWSLGYPGLEQVLRIVQFTMYKLFGPMGFHWYALFTLLHTANGFLLYRVLRQVNQWYQVPNPRLVAVVSALLFLLSPYQTEVLVWRVCLNYLMAGFFVLLTLTQMQRYLQSGQSRHLWWSIGWMLLGLFSFELALAGPVLVVGVVCLALLSPGFRPQRGKAWRLAFLHLALVPLYFLARKLILGDWVGYYGAEVHLNFDLKIILGNIFKYFTKLTVFLRYWDHPTKERIFLSFEDGFVLKTLTWAGLIAYALLFIFFRKVSRRVKLGAGLLLLFVLGLGPAINLYSAYILQVENDRYGYIASFFCVPALVVLLTILPRLLRYIGWAVLLGFSGYFLIQTTTWWRLSDEVYKSLLADYRWEEAAEVYILACPDNYEGILIFKDYSWKNLTVIDALEWIQGKDVKGTIYQVGMFNMNAPDNSVSVQQDSSGLLQVQFNQPGNWWWHGGIGALDYDKPQFTFTRQGAGYLLELKAIHPEAVFIYSEGGEWREWDALK